MKSVYLAGRGTAVPRHFMNQQDAAKMVKTFTLSSPGSERWVPKIYQKSTVQQRGFVLLEQHAQGLKPVEVFSPIRSSLDEGPSTEDRMALYKKEAPILAIEAARNALCDAEMTPQNIRYLVTVSCTGFSAPGFDIELIKTIGLSSDVNRTHIGFMGCHGFFNALRVAQALAAEGNVLVVSVELCSIHVAYGSDPGRMVANALFADGASAAIVSRQKRKPSNWRLQATASYLFPNSQDLMGWEIGNHGFRMHLSPEIPKVIESSLKPFIIDWLKKNHLSLSKIRSWAVHPGGPRILDAVELALGLKTADLVSSRHILTQYGNMSSATILYIVDELIKRKYQMPCLAMGFGPGLNLELALFE